MQNLNFKRMLSILLTLCLTLSLLPVGVLAAAGAKDLDGYWASSAIETCHTYGIMNGDGNGYYMPNDDITRAEFAAMVNRAFGYDALTVPELSGYKDVPTGAWYTNDTPDDGGDGTNVNAQADYIQTLDSVVKQGARGEITVQDAIDTLNNLLAMCGSVTRG